ncbi:tetratricopeptide repeat protein [Actinoallomurus sp. NPDC052274]|uniref:tetratricopeptide repeat protein n=1 Tax=Actinoallomurus sp. NPDC052274 TaxID=3155420 RepID=UPI00343A102D
MTRSHRRTDRKERHGIAAPQTGPGADRDASTSNYLSDATVGAAVQARCIRGDITINSRPPLRITPRQLPRGPARLVDRATERSALDGMPADATIVITGPGGSGKTALALAWLQQIADRYPDGQLFADMRGYSIDGPIAPARILGEWLRALGITPEHVPEGLDEREALFRSLTAERRLVVVIDNAASGDQVQRLMPGSGCLVVITTRRRLRGLVMAGARLLALGPLDEPSALKLLDLIIGAERREAETAAALELVHACGRLPLPLCVSAATLATHPDWQITSLTSGSTSPDPDPDDGAMTAFDSAYNALPDETRRAYRLLIHNPGNDITPGSAAALLGRTVEAATDRMEQLVEARLMDEESGRYFFHDVVAEHARATAQECGSHDDSATALTRHAYWYLRMAAASARAIIGARWYLGAVFTAPPIVQITEATALDWLEKERYNLAAVAEAACKRGQYAVAWQIAEAMWPLFVRHRHSDLWVLTYELGHQAARAAGDPEAEARMLQGQASAALNRHDFAHAAGLADQALELARMTGHRHAEGTSLEQLGLTFLGLRQSLVASEHFHAAREIYRGLEDERGAAIMTRHLGEAALEAELYEEAIKHLIEADGWFAQQPEEGYLRSRCLGPLGRAYRIAGRLDDARTALDAALELARATGAHQQQAELLEELAEVAVDLGQSEIAHRHLREAYAIYEGLRAPEADRIAQRLTPTDND